MRVYIPDPRAGAVNEILKDLYLLRQAIDYDSGTVDSRLKMIDQIRNKVQTLVKEE